MQDRVKPVRETQQAQQQRGRADRESNPMNVILVCILTSLLGTVEERSWDIIHANSQSCLSFPSKQTFGDELSVLFSKLKLGENAFYH